MLRDTDVGDYEESGDAGVVSALQEAGLTGYQSRAYMTLAKLGQAKVLPLARESGIPRNKLYHVLQDLEGVGLVSVTEREPLTYQVEPMRAFLEHRIERLNELLAQFGQTQASTAQPGYGATSQAL